jgi:alkanesulfonate monooxygenase SsuD/methylene tetrahydromethanopterin reductase-like flavin-dependent oxidoreductase (luciferase family)
MTSTSRSRDWLERTGVRCLRHRAGHARAAQRPVRRGLRGPDRAAVGAGDRFVAGRYYQLADARCGPKPVQQPYPPLCVGGSGEKRTLRTAARFAQHWNFDAGTPAQFARAREIVCRHCADLGRDPAGILRSAQVRFTGDPARAAADAAAFGAAGAGLAIVYLPAPHIPAVLEPLASALSALRGG